MGEIIDGKALAKDIRSGVKAEIDDIRARGYRAPKLVVVIVGEDEASKVYVGQKERVSKKLGMESEVLHLPEETPEERVLEVVRALNTDPNVDGILVQLPLPEHISERTIIEAIDPLKDVDGFHPVNMGRLMAGNPYMVPCTPAGIMKLIESTGTVIKGARAVVVGRSNIVGKPVAMLLLHAHATVTVCHSRTRDLGAETRQGDILVSAVGRPHIITEDMVKEGAVVIDVGINRVNGTLVGDVDFHAVKDKASYITPVPGGVGPMTVAMLMSNTLQAYRKRME